MPDEYFANKNEIEISGDFLNACKDLNIEKVKYLIENKNGLINKTSINEGCGTVVEKSIHVILLKYFYLIFSYF